MSSGMAILEGSVSGPQNTTPLPGQPGIVRELNCRPSDSRSATRATPLGAYPNQSSGVDPEELLVDPVAITFSADSLMGREAQRDSPPPKTPMGSPLMRSAVIISLPEGNRAPPP